MPDFMTTLVNPSTGRRLAAKVRNTSHLSTIRLLALFEETLRRTWERGDCKPEQFSWMVRDLRLQFKTMRPSRSHFSGYVRHANPDLPVFFMLRFAKDCPLPYIALMMEHEIRHPMGENHRAMADKPWRAYHMTRQMVHHYAWAESFWNDLDKLAAVRSY